MVEVEPAAERDVVMLLKARELVGGSGGHVGVPEEALLVLVFHAKQNDGRPVVEHALAGFTQAHADRKVLDALLEVAHDEKQRG